MLIENISLVHFNYQAKSDPACCCYAIWQDITIKAIPEIVCYNLIIILALSAKSWHELAKPLKDLELHFSNLNDNIQDV